MVDSVPRYFDGMELTGFAQGRSITVASFIDSAGNTLTRPGWYNDASGAVLISRSGSPPHEEYQSPDGDQNSETNDTGATAEEPEDYELQAQCHPMWHYEANKYEAETTTMILYDPGNTTQPPDGKWKRGTYVVPSANGPVDPSNHYVSISGEKPHPLRNVTECHSNASEDGHNWFWNVDKRFKIPGATTTEPGTWPPGVYYLNEEGHAFVSYKGEKPHIDEEDEEEHKLQGIPFSRSGGGSSSKNTGTGPEDGDDDDNDKPGVVTLPPDRFKLEVYKDWHKLLTKALVTVHVKATAMPKTKKEFRIRLKELVEQVNKFRKESGLEPLCWPGQGLSDHAELTAATIGQSLKRKIVDDNDGEPADSPVKRARLDGTQYQQLLLKHNIPTNNDEPGEDIDYDSIMPQGIFAGSTPITGKVKGAPAKGPGFTKNGLGIPDINMASVDPKHLPISGRLTDDKTIKCTRCALSNLTTCSMNKPSASLVLPPNVQDSVGKGGEWPCSNCAAIGTVDEHGVESEERIRARLTCRPDNLHADIHITNWTEHGLPSKARAQVGWSPTTKEMSKKLIMDEGGDMHGKFPHKRQASHATRRSMDQPTDNDGVLLQPDDVSFSGTTQSLPWHLRVVLDRPVYPEKRNKFSLPEGPGKRPATPGEKESHMPRAATMIEVGIAMDNLKAKLAPNANRTGKHTVSGQRVGLPVFLRILPASCLNSGSGNFQTISASGDMIHPSAVLYYDKYKDIDVRNVTASRLYAKFIWVYAHMITIYRRALEEWWLRRRRFEITLAIAAIEHDFGRALYPESFKTTAQHLAALRAYRDEPSNFVTSDLTARHLRHYGDDADTQERIFEHNQFLTMFDNMKHGDGSPHKLDETRYARWLYVNEIVKANIGFALNKDDLEELFPIEAEYTSTGRIRIDRSKHVGSEFPAPME